MDKCAVCQAPLVGFFCPNCGQDFAGTQAPQSKQHTVRQLVPIRSNPAVPLGINQSLLSHSVRQRGDAHAGIIAFAKQPEVLEPIVRANEISCPHLQTRPNTNLRAGLDCAGWLIAESQQSFSQLNVIVMADGKVTDGRRSPFGSDVEATIESAVQLKQQGVRIATVAFQGGKSLDLELLAAIASGPSLFMPSWGGHLTTAFLTVTKSLTQRPSINPSSGGAKLFLLVVDVSLSMDEGNKLVQLGEAIRTTLGALQAM